MLLVHTFGLQNKIRVSLQETCSLLSFIYFVGRNAVSSLGCKSILLENMLECALHPQ